AWPARLQAERRARLKTWPAPARGPWGRANDGHAVPRRRPAVAKRRLCWPGPTIATTPHGTHFSGRGQRGSPSELPPSGEAVAGAGRRCARFAVSAQPHWCRATTCSYWTRRSRFHIVATTLPFPVFFLRRVAHCCSPPTSGSPPLQGTGCVAPLDFHSIFRRFPYYFHAMRR